MMTMVKKGVARQMTNSVPSTPSRHRIHERRDIGMASSTVKMSFRRSRRKKEMLLYVEKHFQLAYPTETNIYRGHFTRFLFF